MRTQAPKLSDQLGDIQAILGTGFGWLTSSQFCLLTVRDLTLAKAWLASVQTTKLLMSIEALNLHGEELKEKVTEAVAVAFSFDGLAAFGLAESSEFPFPTPFRSAMGSGLRKALLRDNARDAWRWADRIERGCAQPVHLLVANWWKTGAARRMPEPCPAAFSISRVDGCPSFFKPSGIYEPFGFRDGIAQPVMYGLRVVSETRAAAAGRMALSDLPDRDSLIAPGEFILGYRNEYDEVTYTADVDGWRGRDPKADASTKFTLNGSFLAVRQVEQDVDAFRAWSKGAAGLANAEKLVGRRRDGHGTPMAWTGAGCPLSDAQADAFRYRVADSEGFACPRGAHVRRANPRDSLGHDVDSSIRSSKLHRLLRRGRPYRETIDGTERQGIMFIACNADLERQFEFVHQRWLQNLRFAKLEAENDPLVGAGCAPLTYSMPGLPAGESISLSSFTTSLGGGYFFLPGLNALQYIQSCPAPPNLPLPPQR